MAPNKTCTMRGRAPRSSSQRSGPRRWSALENGVDREKVFVRRYTSQQIAAAVRRARGKKQREREKQVQQERARSTSLRGEQRRRARQGLRPRSTSPQRRKALRIMQQKQREVPSPTSHINMLLPTTPNSERARKIGTQLIIKKLLADQQRGVAGASRAFRIVINNDASSIPEPPRAWVNTHSRYG